MTRRLGFVGLAWWGLGPGDMAAAMENAGYFSDSLGLWNIRSRYERLVLKSPFSSFVAMQRLKEFAGDGKRPEYEAIFVISPHRLSLRMLSYLKKRSRYLVGVLGDDPVGARAVSESCWNQFDLVVAADNQWLDRLSGFQGKRRIMPWGSTLLDPALVRSDVYTPESLVIVGAPYPERVHVAINLAARNALTLQGDDWPSIDGVHRRSSSSRARTLNAIRKNREMVVNIHHKQFQRGLNPQFFDYAAAGIPQVVIYADDLAKFHVGLSGHDIQGRLEADQLLRDEQVLRHNQFVVSQVREHYMFHSCIERVLDVF